MRAASAECAEVAGSPLSRHAVPSADGEAWRVTWMVRVGWKRDVDIQVTEVNGGAFVRNHVSDIHHSQP